MREALAEKIFVLGIDGMDPLLTNKYLAEGKMPHTKALVDRGIAREDLVLLGAHPTITPPMWTTLATGAYPVTHGITCFSRQSSKGIDTIEYNFDSTNCRAEQLWNVFAEAGWKTLVWHWPGSSWPPSSDNPNLHVVDGTQPAGVNISAAVDGEFLLVADQVTEELIFRQKAASDTNIPCVVNDLKPSAKGLNQDLSASSDVLLCEEDGEGVVSEIPFDVVLSPIKPAHGWTYASEDGYEFILLLSGGLLRRPALILKNDQGIYDRVAIYKSKKEATPIVILENNVFTDSIPDEAVKGDDRYQVVRNMRLLTLAEDGQHLKMWISAAVNIDNDRLWHPKTLYKTIVENVGYPQPFSFLGGSDKVLISDCSGANWTAAAKWQAGCLNYLMEHEGYRMVFSHFHNIDLQGHMIVKYLKDKGQPGAKLSEAEYQDLLRDIYIQTDHYIGDFLHLLDKGWTILLVSDHGQVCPEHDHPLLGDPTGVNVRVMEELGFTAVKKDAAGNDLHEIDWAKTKAVAVRGNQIYLNIKGKNGDKGIVDPEDQYELEEEIMTALYGYKDKKTGRRVVAMALRNRDAVLLGMGGDQCGDIVYWTAEGYNMDHGDSLSTTLGYAQTSVSPIFAAAGPGLKQGKTDRIIRQVDFAPTIAVLGGVRMPAQCEGAPAYQILAKEY